MDKKHAIQLLGGTTTAAAKAIGITPQAISMWPDTLSDATRDRVEAAIARLKRKRPYTKSGCEISIFKGGVPDRLTTMDENTP